MLFFVVTVFALLATALISTHWQQLSLGNGGVVLGTVLTGSVLWLLYCAVQLGVAIYKLAVRIGQAIAELAARIGQAIAERLHLITVVVIVLLVAWSLSLIWQLVSQKNDGFCGNGDISFGAREAVMTVGILEDQPVGVVRCRNLLEYRCVAEGEQPIPAGTRVELVRWFGNKLVVRPLTETTSVA